MKMVYLCVLLVLFIVLVNSKRNSPTVSKPTSQDKKQQQAKQPSIDQIVGAMGDFKRNYEDMKEANHIGADKYFHAKANYEASKRGPAGKATAKVLSSIREDTDILRSAFDSRKPPIAETIKDSREDQKANRHGQNGGDPNDFRPKKLPKKY